MDKLDKCLGPFLFCVVKCKMHTYHTHDFVICLYFHFLLVRSRSHTIRAKFVGTRELRCKLLFFTCALPIPIGIRCIDKIVQQHFQKSYNGTMTTDWIELFYSKISTTTIICVMDSSIEATITAIIIVRFTRFNSDCETELNWM